MKQKARALFGRSSIPLTRQPVLGLVLVAVSAMISARVFAGKPGGTFLPLVFVAVLFALALFYGAAVGVLGSLIAAVVFAHTLYAPIGNWRVASLAARQSLAWMILASVVLSYLFVPVRSGRERQ